MSIAIDWPWEYNFPPFFTIQVNEETLKHQLSVWRSLIIAFMKASSQCVLDVREAQRSPLFRNTAINRTLSEEGILLVMKDLNRTGHAEAFDKTQNQWYIFWEPLNQLGASIYKWASDRGITGSVCTFYELTQGEDTVGEPFYKLQDEVLAKALNVLQLQNKAEVMEFEGNKGVKFF